MQHRTRAALTLTSSPTARNLLGIKVRRALGFRGTLAIQRDETATDITVWSMRELQDVYALVGGSVAFVPVTRTISDGTEYSVIEATLTTQLPGLATASITTDWDPADELYGYELPVVRDYTTAGARRG